MPSPPENERRATCRTHRLGRALHVGWVVLLPVFVLPVFMLPGETRAMDREVRRWKLSTGDCQLQTLRHRRLDDSLRVPGCDHLQLHAGRGTFAYAVHPLSPISVIAELRMGVTVRSTRSGHQVLVRVVLPRTIHPETGQPVTLFLNGSTGSATDTWQTLTVEDLGEQLQRRIRVLRSGSTIASWDAREAYVDLVAVNVYGGPGTTEIWLRDPEVEGLAYDGPPDDNRDGRDGIVQVNYVAPPAASESPQEIALRLEGEVFLVDGRPFFARGIDDCGEDWSYLRGLGFNLLRLPAPATAQQILRAEQLDLWLLTPPPTAWRGGDLGRPFRRVLAWDLGGQLTARDVPERSAVARRTRDFDARIRRPILAGADTSLRSYNQFAEILLHHREPLGSTFRLHRYRAWLEDRRTLSRPGTPHWAVIQTEALPAIERQAAGFGFDPSDTPLILDPSDLHTLTRTAAASGMRGLVFASQHRLDADSDRARLRAATLRLLNLQLEIMEPWMAAGMSATAATSNDPRIHVAVLRTERAWLAIPLWNEVNLTSSTNSTNSTSGQAIPAIDITVPGVPVSSEAFELTPGGLRRLSHRRVAGGLQFTLPEPAPSSMVIISRDPLVVSKTERKLAAQVATAAELTRQIAEAVWRQTSEIAAAAPDSSGDRQAVSRTIHAARIDLDQCQLLLDAGRFPQVHSKATGVLVDLRQTRRELQQRAAPSRLLHSPLCSYPCGLSWHWDWLSRNPRSAARLNLLPTGDFEDLHQLRSEGWEIHEHAPPHVLPRVGLSNAAPQKGEFCLRIEVQPPRIANQHSALDSPPVWIESPPVDVAAGQVVLITGWIKVLRSVQGSQDGAMVFDSLGGPELAVRVSDQADWQRFSMLRAVDQSGPIRLTVALTGWGAVEIDEFQIALLHRAPLTTRAVPIPKSEARSPK